MTVIDFKMLFPSEKDKQAYIKLLKFKYYEIYEKQNPPSFDALDKKFAEEFNYLGFTESDVDKLHRFVLKLKKIHEKKKSSKKQIPCNFKTKEPLP